MALSRIVYLRLNSNLFSLHLKKCNYQKNIFFLSTSTISYSNVQKEGQFSKIFKKYENFIEKKFPRYYLLHRQIVDGSKWCISDFKMYRSLRKGLKSNEVTIDNFSKKELECYIQFPSDFIKMMTVLFLIQFPIIGEIIIIMS
uniref:LETM1 domain-containing protein n=1 Tax=Strongyloides venezuelensis TaxID=75913 RepID=A0A0K0F836_STRVS